MEFSRSVGKQHFNFFMADGTDIKLKAFDSVSEWSKQIVTIASATLVLTASFIKDILSGKIVDQPCLTWAWILLLACVASSVLVLGAISASLNKGNPAQLDVYDPAIIVAACVQLVLFAAGMGFFVYFAAANLSASHPVPEIVPSKAVATFNQHFEIVHDAYFDVGKSDITRSVGTLSGDLDVLKAALREFPNAVVTVEGHCDEKGSPKYNVLLGYRRATVVRSFLIDHGVPAAKLRVASYGKDSPQCRESREDCRQKNRRVHLAPSE